MPSSEAGIQIPYHNSEHLEGAFPEPFEYLHGEEDWWVDWAATGGSSGSTVRGRN